MLAVVNVIDRGLMKKLNDLMQLNWHFGTKGEESPVSYVSSICDYDNNNNVSLKPISM